MHVETSSLDFLRPFFAGAIVANTDSFGRIQASGKDALDLLHRLSTNDLLAMRPNGVRGTVFTTEKGRIVDRATVAVQESMVLLLISPGNAPKVLAWLEKYHITEDAEFTDITSTTGMLCVIGPAAAEVVSTVLGRCPEQGTSMRAGRGEEFLLIRSVRGRLPWIDIIGRQMDIVRLHERLAGSPGQSPASRIDAGEFELLRICMGVPLAPGELTEDFNPYDAGLRDEISYTKGCYIGQEVIARLETYQKVRRGLGGILLDERILPEGGGLRLMKEGREVGRLTSCSPVSVRGVFPGLCVFHSDMAKPGDAVTVLHTPTPVRGIVAGLPIEA